MELVRKMSVGHRTSSGLKIEVNCMVRGWGNSFIFVEEGEEYKILTRNEKGLERKMFILFQASVTEQISSLITLTYVTKTFKGHSHQC